MSEQNSLQALQDAFFDLDSTDLLAEIRAGVESGEERALHDHIRDTAGIADEQVIGLLVDLNLGWETAAAISLVPLIQVAWADGNMAATERTNILAAAEEQGMDKTSSAYKILQKWLAQQPGDNLFNVWQTYMRSFAANLDDEHRSRLQTLLVERAELVGAAQGGIAHIGSISASEKQEIDRIRAVFD